MAVDPRLDERIGAQELRRDDAGRHALRLDPHQLGPDADRQLFRRTAGGQAHEVRGRPTAASGITFMGGVPMKRATKGVAGRS
jgi:hypothetical protein